MSYVTRVELIRFQKIYVSYKRLMERPVEWKKNCRIWRKRFKGAENKQYIVHKLMIIIKKIIKNKQSLTGLQNIIFCKQIHFCT